MRNTLYCSLKRKCRFYFLKGELTFFFFRNPKNTEIGMKVYCILSAMALYEVLTQKFHDSYVKIVFL